MSTVSSVSSVTPTTSSSTSTVAASSNVSKLSANDSAAVKKEKQKFSAFNINSLYKGKSLENPKTSATVPKHGLQTVGKVGAGRRVPPPANVPSVRSTTSSSNNSNSSTNSSNNGSTANNPNVNIVPTGGQGWAASKDDDSLNSETCPNTTTTVLSTTVPSLEHDSLYSPNSPPAIPQPKSYDFDTVNRIGGDAGDDVIKPQADQKFAQEFPQLSAGNSYDSITGTTIIKNSSRQASSPPLYSSKDSLGSRKHNYGIDGNNIFDDGGLDSDGHLMQSNKSNRKSHLSSSSSSSSSSSNLAAQSVTSGAALNSNNYFLPESVQRQMQQQANYNNQQPSFISRSNSGANSKFPNSTSSSSYPTSRSNSSGQVNRKPAPPPPETKCFSREMPSIISEHELKSLDQILEKQLDDGWTLEEEIDYNAKIEFSDDDEDEMDMSSKNDDLPDSKTQSEAQDKGSESNMTLDSCEDREVANSAIKNDFKPPPNDSDSMKPYPLRQGGGAGGYKDNSRYYGRKSDSVYEFSRKDEEYDNKNASRKGEFHASSRSQQLVRGGQSGGYNSYQPAPVQLSAPRSGGGARDGGGNRGTKSNEDDNWRPKRSSDDIPRAGGGRRDDDVDDIGKGLLPPPKSDDVRVLPPPIRDNSYRDYGPSRAPPGGGGNFNSQSKSQQSYPHILPPRLQRQVEMAQSRQNSSVAASGYSEASRNGPMILSRDYDREPTQRHRRTPPEYSDQRSGGGTGRSKMNSEASWRKPSSSYDKPVNHEQRRDSESGNNNNNKSDIAPPAGEGGQYPRKTSYDMSSDYQRKSTDTAAVNQTEPSPTSAPRIKDSLYSVENSDLYQPEKPAADSHQKNPRSGGGPGSMRILSNDSRRSSRYDRTGCDRGSKPQYPTGGITGPVEVLHRNQPRRGDGGSGYRDSYSTNQSVRKSQSNEEKKEEVSSTVVVESRPRGESDVSSHSSTTETTTAPTASTAANQQAIISPMYPPAPGSNTSIRASVRSAYGPPSTGKSAFGEVPILSKCESNEKASSTSPPPSNQPEAGGGKPRSGSNARQAANNRNAPNSCGSRYRNNSTGSNTSGGSRKVSKNSAYYPSVSPTTNNNESDLNNEEWETASESSDLISMDRANANRDSVPKAAVANNNNEKSSTNRTSAYPAKQDSNSTYGRNRNRPNMEHYQAGRGNRHRSGSGNSSLAHNYHTGTNRMVSDRSRRPEVSSYRGGRADGGKTHYDSRQGADRGGYHGAPRTQQAHHNQQSVIVNQMSKMSLDDPKSTEQAIMDTKLRNRKYSNSSSAHNQRRLMEEDGFSDDASGPYTSTSGSTSAGAMKKNRNRSTSNSSNNKSKRKERSKSKNRNRTNSNSSSNPAPPLSVGNAATNRPTVTNQAKSKDLPKSDSKSDHHHQQQQSKAATEAKKPGPSTSDSKPVSATSAPTAAPAPSKPSAAQLGSLKSSNSFEQHDSGIDSGDQPLSSSTSQRSSPSNDTDSKLTPPVVANASGSAKMITTNSPASAVKCTPSVMAPANATFDSKSVQQKKSDKIPDMIDNSSTPPTSSVTVSKSASSLTTASPPALRNHTNEELNMKIASVKNVWDNSTTAATTSTASADSERKNSLLSSNLQGSVEKKISMPPNAKQTPATVAFSNNQTKPTSFVSTTSPPVPDSMRSVSSYSTNNNSFHPNLVNSSSKSPPTLNQHQLYSANQMNTANMAAAAAAASNTPFQYGQVDSLVSFAAQNALHPVISHYISGAAQNAAAAAAAAAQNQPNTGQFGGQHSVATLINPQSFAGHNPAANLLMAQFAQSQSLSGTAADPHHFNKYQFAANSQNLLSQSMLKAQFVNAAGQQNAPVNQQLGNLQAQPANQQGVANWAGSSLVAQHNTPANANQQHFLPQALATAAAAACTPINFVPTTPAGASGAAGSNPTAGANQYNRHHQQQATQQNIANMNRMDGNSANAVASQNIRNYLQANMMNAVAAEMHHHHQNAQVPAAFLNQDPSGGNRSSHQSQHNMHHHHQRQFHQSANANAANPGQANSNWPNQQQLAAVAQQQLFLSQYQKLPPNSRFMHMPAALFSQVGNQVALSQAQMGSRTSPLNIGGGGAQANYPNPIQRPNNNNQKNNSNNRNNSNNKSFGGKSKNNNYNSYNHNRNSCTPSPGTGNTAGGGDTTRNNYNSGANSSSTTSTANQAAPQATPSSQPAATATVSKDQ